MRRLSHVAKTQQNRCKTQVGTGLNLESVEQMTTPFRLDLKKVKSNSKKTKFKIKKMKIDLKKMKFILKNIARELKKDKVHFKMTILTVNCTR